jgi:hypothetical protein
MIVQYNVGMYIHMCMFIHTVHMHAYHTTYLQQRKYVCIYVWQYDMIQNMYIHIQYSDTAVCMYILYYVCYVHSIVHIILFISYIHMYYIITYVLYVHS